MRKGHVPSHGSGIVSRNSWRRYGRLPRSAGEFRLLIPINESQPGFQTQCMCNVWRWRFPLCTGPGQFTWTESWPRALLWLHSEHWQRQTGQWLLSILYPMSFVWWSLLCWRICRRKTTNSWRNYWRKMRTDLLKWLCITASIKSVEVLCCQVE